MRRGLGTSVLLVEAALLVCLGAFVNVLHADPAPRCEGCDKEWGDVGLNALCRAGMPSTACAQARSEANMVQEGAGGELGAGSLSSPGAQSPPAISPYRVAPGSARYSIAVPGHWEVLSSVTLKVIIHASGLPLPLTSVFQLLIEGRKHVEDNLGEDPGKQHVSPDKWVDGRIWQLADMGESQQPGAVSESFSYVFVFDVSNAADGPLEISLLFHPGEDAEEEGDAGEEGGGEVEERERDRRRSSMIRGSHPAVRPHVIRHEESELHGWVLVEQIEVLLAGHASLAASGGEVEEGGSGGASSGPCVLERASIDNSSDTDTTIGGSAPMSYAPWASGLCALRYVVPIRKAHRKGPSPRRCACRDAAGGSAAAAAAAALAAAAAAKELFLMH